MATIRAANNSGLGSRVAASAPWSIAGGIGRQGIGFLATSILARILSPAAYGLMGMCAVFTNFLTLFVDMGLSHAIVRQETVEEEFLSSVFWVSLGFGLATGVVMVAVAWPAAFWFHEPALRPLLQTLAISFPVSSLGVVPLSLLLRSVSLRQIAISELSSGLLGAIVGITAAFRGAGVWSLILASLVSSGANTAFLWWFSAFHPRFLLHWPQVRRIMAFSANLSAFNFVNYFARNADNMIIGSYLGATELGYYQVAYNLMLYPIQTIGGVLGRIFFPAFSRMKDDLPRLRAAYVRSCAVLAMITFPVMLGLAVVAHPFVRTYLGSAWSKTAILLAILAPVGMVQSISGTVGNIYAAIGRTDVLLRWGLIATATVVTAFMIGKSWGSVGVAAAYAVANALLLYPGFAVPLRLINMALADLAKALAPVFSITLLMAAGTLGTLKALETSGLAAWQLLVMTVAVGASIYVGLTIKVRPLGFADVLASLQTLRGKDGRA